MTVTVTKPALNLREALKRGVSMYGLQIATALQGGALNDVSIGGRTPAAGAFNALSLVSTDDPTLLISNGGGTSPAPTLSLFRQAGVSATISYNAASKNLEIQNDYSTVDAFGNIYFKTRGNNTRMAIDGAGNVGIGTVIPNYSLELWHDTAAALHIHSNRETAGDLAAIYFSTVGSDTSRRKGAIFWQANGGGDGLGDLLFANNSASDAGSADVGDVVMTLKSGGALLHGTTTAGSAGAGDIVVNGGIFLGGSAAINELSDVEKSTYTATITPDTSGTITLAAALDELAYRRVNDAVTVTGFIQVSSVSSPVGTKVRVSLPFTAAADVEQAVRIGTGIFYRDFSAGSRSIEPFEVLESGTYGVITIDASTIEASDEFAFSFTYIAA